MRNFIAILLITLSFSSIYPIHERIQFSLDKKVNSKFEYSLENGGDSQSSNINMKAMLYSAILPGSGEYHLGYKNRGYFFLGIEAITVGTWYMFNQKGLDTQNKYRAYADEHWNLLRWFADYYKWDEDGSEYRYNFINIETGIYPDIWEDSHHLNFSYNGENYSTNSDSFIAFYKDIIFINIYNPYSTNSDEVNLPSLESIGVVVEKDHHYYENIGKYDHFYAGWDDNDSLYVVVKELGGEYIGMSPHKKVYRKVWNDSNDYYRIGAFALSSMVANHFASMMDVLILSKLSNNRFTNLSAKTYYSPLNPYGIGGIKLSFNWK